MSKRKLSKAQRERINEREQQKSRHNEIALHGLVMARFGAAAEIEDDQGVRFMCAIRPTLKDIVAGDRVLWRQENNEQGLILNCEPRTSTLYRANIKRKKLIAANVTQLVIVVAPQPPPSSLLLDSYLVAAEAHGLKAIIVINKVDLPCQELMDWLSETYTPLDYAIVTTTKINNQITDHLLPYLSDEVSVFVGQSGVGKSSLINHLLPHETLSTSEISTKAQLGKHTTSQSRFYHLACHGGLIDSPGIREFGLWGIQPRQLTQGFKDIWPWTQICRFRNCDHQISLDCALTKAVEEGKVQSSRFQNYLQLMQQFKDDF